MWKLSGLFVALSLLLFGWLCRELDLLSFSPAVAAEKGPSAQSPIESLEHALSQKSKALDDREAKLDRREKTIADKETLLKQQLDKYTQIVADLQQKIKKLQAQQSEKVAGFRRVYEGMDAKRAARILDDVEVGLATEILSGMKHDKAGEILGRMSPERARLITERSMRQPAQAANALSNTVSGQ